VVKRVLHIVESLHRGAVENWLLRMLSHASAKDIKLDWTFYCQQVTAGALDDLAQALGARVVHSPVPLSQTWAFMTALRRELRAGHYEVMHCHHDLLSAVYLAASYGLPIGRCIVHAHNADENLPTPNRLKAGLLREPMRRICLTADRVVGISKHTLDTLLGHRPPRPGRDLVHYYGVDPSPFARASFSRIEFRQSLGLAEDAPVMVFGGRITPEKNPVFAVDVFARLLEREPKAALVFAGAGSLDAAVMERARELGVTEHLRMLGWRSDLPQIMGACDWFILPRPEQPMEGFGLAVIEAQLAGLRLVLSEGIPDDPLLETASFRRLSLQDAPELWADAAMEMLNAPAPSRQATLEALRASPMDMDFALEDLKALYT
jgi:glycosyltransferase involved in cell wall biosynthesis